MDTITKQIGSLEVRPTVDDKFISDVQIDTLKFQIEEAEQSGVAKQVEIATHRLNHIEQFRMIRDLNFPEIVVERINELREDQGGEEVYGVGVTKYKEPVEPKPLTRWQRFKKEVSTPSYELTNNYYSIFLIEDFPSSIPASALKTYRNIKDKGIFDRFTVWVRAKDFYNARDGAGLSKSVEKDPYLVGVIEAVDGREQDRWFLVDSWEEEELMP
jgi:hypothetical protein